MFFKFLIALLLLILSCNVATGASASHPEPYLGKEEVRTIVENTITAFSEDYLFPVRTAEVTARLRHELSRGEFTRGYHFGQFRQKFESILVNGTSDTGFELLEIMSPTSLNLSSENAASSTIEAEILPGNIAYLKLAGEFQQPDLRIDLTASLRYLSSSDALIIDLREAGGVSMDFAQHLTSFFLPPGTRMATVVFNSTQAPVHLYAKAQPGFSRLADALPVYILTSALVSGPWEFFCYTLKHYDIATLVGEDTMGVSYMKKGLPVSEHAELTLYYAQLIHPLTLDNWQNTGVFADYQVSAAESAETAFTLARERNQGHVGK